MTGVQTCALPIYIDDVARANVLALQSETVDDDVFNVASGTETSLRELAEVLLTVMGAPRMRPEHGPERSVNSVPRRLACTEKSERLLGFKAEVDLQRGLRQLVDWWRDQRAVAACA